MKQVVFAMPMIEVEVDEEEKADLEEFVKHHPEVKTPGGALKKMAGLKTYRAMKQATDPGRKKPSMLAQDLGIPTHFPCQLGEDLKRVGWDYGEWLNRSAVMAAKLIRQAAKGDTAARATLDGIFFPTSKLAQDRIDALLHSGHADIQVVGIAMVALFG